MGPSSAIRSPHNGGTSSPGAFGLTWCLAGTRYGTHKPLLCGDSELQSAPHPNLLVRRPTIHYNLHCNQHHSASATNPSWLSDQPLFPCPLITSSGTTPPNKASKPVTLPCGGVGSNAHKGLVYHHIAQKTLYFIEGDIIGPQCA